MLSFPTPEEGRRRVTSRDVMTVNCRSSGGKRVGVGERVGERVGESGRGAAGTVAVICGHRKKAFLFNHTRIQPILTMAAYMTGFRPQSARWQHVASSPFVLRPGLSPQE